MTPVLEAPERRQVAEFLAAAGCAPGAVRDDAELGRVFRSLYGSGLEPGEDPCWIDRLIRAARAGDAPVRPPVLCLTHDVDFATSRLQHRKLYRRLRTACFGEGPAWYGLQKAAGSLARILTPWPPRERYGDFIDWLHLEARHGFRSTFLFLPFPEAFHHVYDGDYRFSDPMTFDRRRMTVAQVMREIAAAGWEVGLHGTCESGRRTGMLARQKRMVEDIIGGPVVSCRQHYLASHAGLTPRLQAEAGLRVDSSDGHNRRLGPGHGTSHPYPAWDAQRRAALALTVVPMTAMDTALLAQVRGGQAWPQAQAELTGLFDRVTDSGGVFCANWHPHYLPVDGLREAYERLLAHAERAGAACRLLGSFSAVPDR